MTAFALYLIKVVLCSGILYLYYRLFLRNKFFHQWNRFYLLFTVVLSLVLPLTHFMLFSEPQQQDNALQLLRSMQQADNTLEEFVVVGSRNNAQELILSISYAIICFFFLVSFAVSLSKIIRLIHSHTTQYLHNIKFVITTAEGSPFSFLRYIFWNEKIALHSEVGQQIFKHELVHVQEKHTLDKLFMQIVLMVFWCNPFFWLIRKELQFIHEFIADKKAVGDSDASAFAAMILQAAYPHQFSSLGIPFFQTSIKRRLVMLTKIQNPNLTYGVRLAALPLVAITIFAFSVRAKTIEGSTNANIVKTNANKGLGIITDTIPKKTKEIKSVDVHTGPAKQLENITISYTDGTAETLTKQDAIKRGLITDPNKEKVVIGHPLKKEKSDAEPIFYLDGKEITKAEMQKIEPNTIQSINVLKGDKAKEKYGDKAKNGVVEIYLKAKSSSPTTSNANSSDNRNEVVVIGHPLHSSRTDDATQSNNLVFEQTETPASVDKDTWRKFLEENTTPLIEDISKQAPSGKYTVNVKFIVNTDGNLSDVQALNDPGYSIGGRVVTMMAKAPKWTPAVQNGHVVRSYHTQPITFVITSGKQGEPSNNPPLYNVEDVKTLSFHQLIGVPESDEILSCTLTLDNQHGDVVIVNHNGNAFSERARELLKTAQKDRLLTIENIRVKRDGKEYRIPSKVYAM